MRIIKCGGYAIYANITHITLYQISKKYYFEKLGNHCFLFG